ncbi:LOW QUALITY PROTEIN: UDP-xylose and UDP-N-acetylglucosamine transporter-like [Mya arenaria]|uniref:LOW QUALITY PROTEIN: UDP-xylose and UDP-N-acetylglucosamine transporter-like n=1 Tax=Mya arenaria TaxID=6604 RepID=UPI0022E36E61|nr:LOW QUALITY PROTEIN: UDP-xylose and UDP-N-acetylglucosamine transporter-like [Mya arenaria]
MFPGIPIALTLAGCCSNMVLMELLVSNDPGCGNLVTFTQFLFIACEGFVNTLKFGTVKNKIPLSVYIKMVTMFFMIQVVNNYAFSYDIPVTLHIIFRAGSLMASLTLGVIIAHKRYPISKYVSVLMITLGICVCTYASATGEHPTDRPFSIFNYTLGVSMMVFSLFMTARMGLFQESVYSKHGKHPNESLFFNHALPLPGFLLVAPNIYSAAIGFNQSETWSVLGVMVPKMWIYLLGNNLSQYVCIRSVFVLTSECTALTVTLVVTLRKFLSLLISIWYFSNPFTLAHWAGTFLVFAGTLIFTETIQRVYQLGTKHMNSAVQNGASKKQQ